MTGRQESEGDIWSLAAVSSRQIRTISYGQKHILMGLLLGALPGGQ